MTFLLKFGLGGVQESIAQSRKTRDLAAASKVISRLSEAAANAAGVPIVLPAPGSSAPNWPHQIVIRVDGDETKVREIGNAMVRAAEETWAKAIEGGLASWLEWAAKGEPRLIRIADTVKNALASDSVAVKKQISESIEVYWVAVAEQSDYRTDYRALSQQFDERRHTRTFGALETIESVWPWTCFVCGVRSSIVQPPKEGWPEGIGFATGRERFCAVCAAKRQGFDIGFETFPSTHRLARRRFFTLDEFAPVRAALSETKQFALVNDLDDLVAQPSKAKGRFGDAWTILTEGRSPLLSKVQKLPPYYALILVDGDQMGKWFTGEFGNADLKTQQDRSSALGRFGLELQTTATAADAYPVYIGGDDALLFAPLDALLPLLRAIQTSWPANLQRNGKGPTVTAHASVLHAKEPLQRALINAQRLLAESKRVARNCFSLYADVRGGAAVHCLGTWDDLGPLIAGVEAFSNWRCGETTRPAAALLKARDAARLAGTLPHALIYGTRPIFEVNAGCRDQQLDPSMQRAFALEIDRLLHRSSAKCPEFRNWIVGRGLRGHAGGKVPGEKAFREALLAAAFLARQLEWSAA